MAATEVWQRGPVAGVPGVLQPIAHILLQVQESVHEMVEGLTEEQWNARPAGVASAAFHVRHITGVIDRLFSYARGEQITESQLAAKKSESAPVVSGDVAAVLTAMDAQVAAAVDQ